LELLKEAQASDSNTQQELRAVGTPGGQARPSKASDSQYEKGAEGLLHYDKKIVVPNQRALIGEPVGLYHDDKHAGHWGIEKTLQLLRRKLW